MIRLKPKPSPSLANVLRKTLQRLDSPPYTHTDDPALSRLKSSILRSLAELEIKKADAA